ncbi:MAG: hypothetical protein Q9M20_00420 [Mariprofundaceae bacterium]|nr:hypothetical protein [Mariprofundaceae bacterium]
MKEIDFNAWIAVLLQMTGSQRDRVREQLGSKANSDLGLKLIEQSFTEQQKCPYCTCKELYSWGKSSGLQQDPGFSIIIFMRLITKVSIIAMPEQ